MCNENWIYTTTSNPQLSDWAKKLQSTSQSQTCTTIRSWSRFDGLLSVWPTKAFWILLKLLHLRCILSKSMRGTENGNPCSWHWSTERAQFFCTTAPHLTSYNQCFKNGTDWATTFCLICRIHLSAHHLTTTSSSISTTFCRWNASTTSRMQNMLSKSSLNPEDFYTTGINKLIFHWLNVFIVMVPILINKDMFEPGYNDLKLMVQSHSYISPT